MTKSNQTIKWTADMLLTLRVLKDMSIRRFEGLTNEDTVAIFMFLHGQELTGRDITNDALCGKMQGWKRHPGERGMWQETQRMSNKAKDDKAQAIENAMNQLNIIATRLPTPAREENVVRDMTAQEIEAQRARSSRRALNAANRRKGISASAQLPPTQFAVPQHNAPAPYRAPTVSITASANNEDMLRYEPSRIELSPINYPKSTDYATSSRQMPLPPFAAPLALSRPPPLPGMQYASMTMSWQPRVADFAHQQRDMLSSTGAGLPYWTPSNERQREDVGEGDNVDHKRFRPTEEVEQSHQDEHLSSPMIEFSNHSPGPECDFCGQTTQHPLPGQPVNLRVVTEPTLVEGAICYWSTFSDNGDFHSGWVAAELLHAVESPYDPRTHVPIHGAHLKMAHQVDCSIKNEKIVVQRIDLIDHHEAAYQLGGFIYPMLVDYSNSIVSQDVMLCSGPPFCGICKRRSTSKNKPAITRTIAAGNDVGLPLVHDSDCEVSVPDDRTSIVVFQGRNRAGDGRLPNKPLFDALPDAAPSYIRMTVYFLNANDAVSRPIEVGVCKRDQCMHCINLLGLSQPDEGPINPSSQRYEVFRSDAVIQKGKAKQKRAMPAAFTELLIDPQLLGDTTDAASIENNTSFGEMNY